MPSSARQQARAMGKARWLWLGGWAIEPEAGCAFVRARWPNCQHAWIYPGPTWRDDLLRALEAGVDHLHAYSLGASLLGAFDGFDALPSVTLWAPFRSILAGVAPEGRIALDDLAKLQNALQRRPEAALRQFYRFANLGIPLPPAIWTSMHADALDWGLAQLAQSEPRPSPNLRPQDSAWLGQHDPLVQAEPLLAALTGAQLAPEAGHCISQLITKKARQSTGLL